MRATTTTKTTTMKSPASSSTTSASFFSYFLLRLALLGLWTLLLSHPCQSFSLVGSCNSRSLSSQQPINTRGQDGLWGLSATSDNDSSSSDSSSSSKKKKKKKKELNRVEKATSTTIKEHIAEIQAAEGDAKITDDSDSFLGGSKMNNLALTQIISEEDMLPAAPYVSYDKFLTMQDKRVVVTIRYSGESGLRPFFLTAARKMKTSHPDVVIERRILPPPMGDVDGEAIFEILVDGKIIVGKGRARRQKVVKVDMSRHARSVFVSMQELDIAISRARRRRRPTTTYGVQHTPSSEAGTATDNTELKLSKHAWSSGGL